MPVPLAASVPDQALAVLTLPQPWATLVVAGAKRFESTHLPAPEMLVNARVSIWAAAAGASSFTFRGYRKFPGCRDERIECALTAAGFSIDNLPHSIAVGSVSVLGCYRIAARDRAVCELTDAVPGSAPLPQVTLSKRDHLFGHFVPDRWLWRFADATLFLPGWETGTVRWVNYKHGFGFIRRPDGTDAFLHFSLFPDGTPRPALGEVVRFRAMRGVKGVRAIELQRLSETTDARCEVAA